MKCKWEKKKSNGYREKEGKGDTSRNLEYNQQNHFLKK